MSYYTGQGDYYSGTGDPGIFGGIWGAIKGAAGGLISGGPMGALTGAARGAVRGYTGAAPAVSAPRRVPLVTSGGGVGVRYQTPRIQAQAPVLKTPGVTGVLQRMVPGGATGYQACAPGYHIHKTEGDRCVRNRRMNPANPKALRRAIRRQGAFVALAKRALKGSGYTFKRTGAPTRRRRRRR